MLLELTGLHRRLHEWEDNSPQVSMASESREQFTLNHPNTRPCLLMQGNAAYIVFSIGLVLFAGIMSGLTLGELAGSRVAWPAFSVAPFPDTRLLPECAAQAC